MRGSCSTVSCDISTGDEEVVVASEVRTLGSLCSMKLFQASHPGQRPSHFDVSWPHSVQANAVATRRVFPAIVTHHIVCARDGELR
jgi:hypothetical protein